MRAGLEPFSFLLISIAGWINQRQQQVIEWRADGQRRQNFPILSSGWRKKIVLGDTCEFRVPWLI